MKTRRVLLVAALVAGGAVLHTLESLVPLPLPIPGAKLGLANLVDLIGLDLAGPGVAVAVAPGPDLVTSRLARLSRLRGQAWPGRSLPSSSGWPHGGAGWPGFSGGAGGEGSRRISPPGAPAAPRP